MTTKVLAGTVKCSEPSLSKCEYSKGFRGYLNFYTSQAFLLSTHLSSQQIFFHIFPDNIFPDNEASATMNSCWHFQQLIYGCARCWTSFLGYRFRLIYCVFAIWPSPCCELYFISAMIHHRDSPGQFKLGIVKLSPRISPKLSQLMEESSGRDISYPVHRSFSIH